MLYFSRWKSVSIILAVCAAVVFALPNLLSREQIQALPDWLPKYQMTLGLDLQGGAHLLLQVDEDRLMEERLESLSDDIRRILRTTRIRGRQSKVGTDAIQVRVLNVEQTGELEQALEEVLAPASAGLLGGLGVVEVEVENPSEGILIYRLTQQGIENRVANAVTQSIDVFLRRINELGTSEPLVQREGINRVLVQYPGLTTEEIPRLKGLLNAEAKLSFHLLSNESSAEEVLSTGRVPPGTKVLFEDTDPPTPYLVRSRPLLTGEELVDAQAGFDQRTNEPLVFFRFNSKGSSIFARVTSENVGRPFAIVLDDEVLSAPRINEPIIGGSGQISGNFTPQSANDLAVLLSAGALPASFEFVEERSVGPGLGADSIEAGKNAAIVGAILVLIFMIVTYGTLGIIADIALAANIAMVVALLSVLGATLTLPGIAGIVLTMGMAVDSNVLIYERIREERRNGRNIIQSFDSGFKQALTTILDANITTLIAAVILFYLGSGPVRGFAVTLGIGIFTTVFTAYTFTRLMVAMWVRYRRPTELPARLFGILPETTSFRFMRFRVFSFGFSAVSIIASIILFLVVSLNFGIDFKGGTLFEVRSKSDVSDIADIRSRLGEINVGEVQVQEFGNASDILIRVESQGVNDNAEQSAEALVRAVLEEDYEFRRVEVVGPTVSSELARAGTISVIAALLAIMIYIWFRFEWQFSIGAVVATLHDVLVTIGVFAILQLEFTLATIAALLTIVGYSLNDTVVVYDRIRENLRKYKKMAVSDLLDLSINNMLSRTILTSVTTLLALFSLYFLGGEVLASFTFAMIFGVFVGTYSSIFIAAPLLILFKLRPGQVSSDDQKKIDAEKEATRNTLPIDLPE